MDTSSRSLRPLIPVVVLVVAIAAVWWVRTDDARHVDAACTTWLQHRNQLRDAVSETREAVGRARAESSDVRDEFNDVDQVRGVLGAWSAAGPALRDSLDSGNGSGHGLEQTMSFFLGQVDEQVGFLTESIESGDPGRVEGEIDEAVARFQIVDDLCLTAARRL